MSSKVNKIKKVKELRRMAKKLLSQGIEEVTGNCMLREDKTEVIMKNCKIRFLMS